MLVHNGNLSSFVKGHLDYNLMKLEVETKKFLFAQKLRNALVDGLGVKEVIKRHITKYLESGKREVFETYINCIKREYLHY